MISINETAGNVLGWTAKKFSKGLELAYKNPAKTAATGLVVSLVSKDAANCAIYTVQSLNNKEIPEDKRRFVAYMDLINGAINVVGQVASFLLIEHTLTPYLQGLWTGKMKKGDKTNALFANDNATSIVADVIKNKKEDQDFVKALAQKKGLNVDELLKNAQEISKGLLKDLGQKGTKAKDIATGVGIIVSALATTALIKRTITPLFATPLAGKLADYANAKEAKKKGQDEFYREAAAGAAVKYENKMDKTAFSNISSRQSS